MHFLQEIYFLKSLSTIATPKRTDYVLIATKNHHENFQIWIIKKIKLQKSVFSGLINTFSNNFASNLSLF